MDHQLVQKSVETGLSQVLSNVMIIIRSVEMDVQVHVALKQDISVQELVTQYAHQSVEMEER